MTTESVPCVHTQRQQETRIVDAIAQLTSERGVFAPFFLIQARTGIPPVELGYVLDTLSTNGTLMLSDIGGYRLVACPHDAAFQAMETAQCAYCGAVWP